MCSVSSWKAKPAEGTVSDIAQAGIIDQQSTTSRDRQHRRVLCVAPRSDYGHRGSELSNLAFGRCKFKEMPTGCVPRQFQ